MPTIAKKKPKPLGARARKKSDARLMAQAASAITKVILAKIAAGKPRYLFKADALASIATKASAVRVAALKYERDLKAGAVKFRAGEAMPANLVEDMASLHKKIAACTNEIATVLDVMGTQYNYVRNGMFEQVVDLGADDTVLSNVMTGLQSLRRDHGQRFSVTIEPGRTVVRVLMERFKVVQDRNLRASYGPFVLTFDANQYRDGPDSCILAVPTKDCPIYGKTNRYHPHVTAHTGTICMGEAGPFIKDAYRAGRIWDIYDAVNRLLRDPNYPLNQFIEQVEFKCVDCGKWAAWNKHAIATGNGYCCDQCRFVCPLSGRKHPRKNGVRMGGALYGPESVIANKLGKNPILVTACLVGGSGKKYHPDDTAICSMSGGAGVLVEPDGNGRFDVEEDSIIRLPDGRNLAVRHLDLICKVATKEQNDGTTQEWQSIGYWAKRLLVQGTDPGHWIAAFRAKIDARQAARPAQADQD